MLILNAETLLLQKHICFDLNQFPSRSWNWLGNRRIYFFSLLLPVPAFLKHYISLADYSRVDRLSWKQIYLSVTSKRISSAEIFCMFILSVTDSCCRILCGALSLDMHSMNSYSMCIFVKALILMANVGFEFLSFS